MLILRCSDVVDREELEKAREELVRTANQDEIQHVLVDLRHTYLALSSYDQVEFSGSNHKHLPFGTDLAILIDADDPDIQEYETIETAGMDRGLDLLVFTDQKEAEKWLRAS